MNIRFHAKEAWELVIGAVIVAVIFMLVRPGSPVSTVVKDIGDALTAMIKTATGQF